MKANSMGLHYALTIFGLVLASIGSLRAQDGELLKNQFLKESPRRWTEYGEFLNRLQGTFSSTREVDGQVTNESTGKVKQNSDCKLISRQFSVISDSKNTVAGNGFLWAFNSNYSFSLRQKTKDGAWAIKELTAKKDGKPSNSVDDANGSTAVIGVLVRIGTTHLAELMQQPTFRVLNAKKVEHLGRPAVSIEFDNQHKPFEKGKTFSEVQGGTMILDPDRCWCVQSYEIDSEYLDAKGKTRAELSYRDSSSNYPIPVRVVETGKGLNLETGKPTSSSWLHEFDLHEPAQLPDYREFTLTAFGLPEPVGMPAVRPAGSRWYIWIALTAFGVIGLAVAIRIRKGRNQGIQSTEKPAEME